MPSQACQHVPMQKFLLKTAVNACALGVTAMAVPGIRLGEEAPALSNRIVTIILVAVLFGIVNALIKPVAQFFSFPFILLTLGLFTVVVNALMLQLTAWIAGGVGLDFSIDSFFWAAVLGSLVVSFISMLLNTLIPDDKPLYGGSTRAVRR